MVNFSFKSNRDASHYRLGEYSIGIKRCLSDALTQHIATYGIEDDTVIESLSWFCDLVAYSIENQMISSVCGVNGIIPLSFKEDVFEGPDLRYLHYPEPIKDSVMHAIRVFLIQYKSKFEVMRDCHGVTLDQLEELADNVAYFIEIQTSRNNK